MAILKRPEGIQCYLLDGIYDIEYKIINPYSKLVGGFNSYKQTLAYQKGKTPTYMFGTTHPEK